MPASAAQACPHADAVLRRVVPAVGRDRLLPDRVEPPPHRAAGARGDHPVRLPDGTPPQAHVIALVRGGVAELVRPPRRRGVVGTHRGRPPRQGHPEGHGHRGAAGPHDTAATTAVVLEGEAVLEVRLGDALSATVGTPAADRAQRSGPGCHPVMRNRAMVTPPPK